MTQISSLLVVATVFTWLIIYNVCILQSGGGAFTQDKTTYAGTRAKSAGALMRKGEGGRNCRILWYYYVNIFIVYHS